MSNFQKLYSYYFTNLLRKNWIKITLIVALTTIWTWFGLSFAFYKLGKAGGGSEGAGRLLGFAGANQEEIEEAWQSYPNLCHFGTQSQGAKAVREALFEAEENAWKDLKEAQSKNDQAKIKQARGELSWIKVFKITGNIFSAPCQKQIVNDFFLDIEGKNKGMGWWKLINDLGYWALGTGVFTFAWLTLSLIDFLFLEPKKNGEEALILNFTPGVKREDLLFSKVAAFLTYFALFSLVSFVLPFLLWYLGVGGIVSAGKVLGLFGYLLIAAPLLIFGLLLLPYILIGSWSPTLASLIPWILVGVSWAWTILTFSSTWTLPHTVENLFFHPLVFTSLAFTVGTSCFSFCYLKNSTEDLKL